MTGYVVAAVAAVAGVVQLRRRRVWAGAAVLGLAVWLLLGSAALDLAAVAAVTTLSGARRRDPGPVWFEPGEGTHMSTTSTATTSTATTGSDTPAGGQDPTIEATPVTPAPAAPALPRPYVRTETGPVPAGAAVFWSRQAAVRAVRLVPGVDWLAVAAWSGGRLQDHGDGVPALVLGDEAATEGDWVVDAPAGVWPMSDAEFRERLAPAAPDWPTRTGPVDAAAVERLVMASLDGLLELVAERCGTATRADIALHEDLRVTRQVLDRVRRELVDRGQPLLEVATAVRAGEPLL